MNFNRKRHKTLKILSKKYIQFESGQTESNFILGTDFKDLRSKLKCDKNKCELVFAPLFTNVEVEYTNVGVDGLSLTQIGLTAFVEKKYSKQNNAILLGWLKTFVQIVIPILSLIVAILAITIKIKNLNSETSREIEAIEKTQQQLKNSIDTLEMKTKNLQIEILDDSKTDSISLKN